MMTRHVVLASALLLGAAPPALAQAGLVGLSPELVAPAAQRVETPTVAYPSSGAREARGRATTAAGSSILRRVVYSAATGVLGVGLGYFTSHVLYNDWNKSSNSTYAHQRKTYALAGGIVGVGVGALFGGGSGSAGGRDILAPRRYETVGNGAIGPAELADAGGGSALDIVQRLRPTWLIIRESKRLSEQGAVRQTDEKSGVVVQAGVPAIEVYLDQSKMGGIEALQQIPVASIAKIERLDPSQANFRLGGGHNHGVILVTTVGASTDMVAGS